MELYRGPCLAVVGGGTTPSGVLGTTTSSPPAFSLTGLPATPAAGTALSFAAGNSVAVLLGMLAPLLWPSALGAVAVLLKPSAGLAPFAGTLSSSKTGFEIAVGPAWHPGVGRLVVTEDIMHIEVSQRQCLNCSKR